ncbi:MAG: acyltransferase family protein [Ruminococcus sp.]|nr:acyltransferase family protein [Ruminococcus sp.]
MKERDYLWDNIKALLIFFVVAGHVLEMNPLHTDLAMNIDSFIYSFHMPAFVFASGYFSKRICTDGRLRAEKAITVMAYYVIFQALFMLIRLIFGIMSEGMSLFSPCTGLWYLLALFAYYLLTPIAEKLPPWFMISLSVVLALLIGNDTAATNYLAVMRTFTFAPFFFAGYYISGNVIKKARALKLCARLPIGILCGAASVCSWLYTPMFPWNKLFFGKINYQELRIDMWLGALMRLWVYAIAALMIICLIMIMPSKKSIVSKVGQNSLQVYIFHMLLVILLFVSGWANIDITDDFIFLLSMLGAAAVTAVLSLWFFGYPFKWIQTGVNKLCSLRKSNN